MADYRRLSDGKKTTADDPQRGIWYGVGSNCRYWTDDWSKLRVTGPMAAGMGIPCCPKCGCPGMQTTAEDWFSGAQKFEDQGNPHYVEFCNRAKELCGTRTHKNWMTRYKEFAADRKVSDDLSQEKSSE